MTASPDELRGAAKIAFEMRAKIESGELRPGDRLPLTRELTRDYGVTGETVRQAIIKLKAAGLVLSKRGSGVYVREWRPIAYWPQEEFGQAPPNDLEHFMAELPKDERTFTGLLEVEVAEPAPEIQERLNLSSRQKVVVRRQTRSVGEQRFNIRDCYFPHRLVKGSALLSAAPLTIGEEAALAALGFEPVRALDEIYIRMPAPDEALRLKLQPGTPVGFLRSTWYDADGLPVATVVNVLPGDRHVLAYERRKPSLALQEGTSHRTPAGPSGRSLL